MVFSARLVILSKFPYIYIELHKLMSCDVSLNSLGILSQAYGTYLIHRRRLEYDVTSETFVCYNGNNVLFF